MVGAVGIENNDVRHFKDLPGMQRNAKSLKWNERARKGILIAPSKLPRISSFQWNSLPSRLEDSVGFGPKFCGTDGKPTLDPENQTLAAQRACLGRTQLDSNNSIYHF